MSRSERLLQLLEVLRRHRRPIAAATIADELGISLRSVYRDIATLQAQGADIRGEPGIGYILRPGFMLPPLMFTDDEIEAIVLGARWVIERGDPSLSRAASGALAKVLAVLPNDMRDNAELSPLLVGPQEPIAVGECELPAIRASIRRERKLVIEYSDEKGDKTHRQIWPVALAYFDKIRVVVAWCELRQAFRHFRTDRILSVSVAEERYPRRRVVMLAEWRRQEGLSADQKSDRMLTKTGMRQR